MRNQCFIFIGIAIVQLVLSFACLHWAVPLFGDPPFLHNGLTREYKQIYQLLQGREDAAETLSLLHKKLEWLYTKHHEGVFVGLAVGFSLFLSGTLTMINTLLLWKRLRA